MLGDIEHAIENNSCVACDKTLSKQERHKYYVCNGHKNTSNHYPNFKRIDPKN